MTFWDKNVPLQLQSGPMDTILKRRDWPRPRNAPLSCMVGLGLLSWEGSSVRFFWAGFFLKSVAPRTQVSKWRRFVFIFISVFTEIVEGEYESAVSEAVLFQFYLQVRKVFYFNSVGDKIDGFFLKEPSMTKVHFWNSSIDSAILFVSVLSERRWIHDQYCQRGCTFSISNFWETDDFV